MEFKNPKDEQTFEKVEIVEGYIETNDVIAWEDTDYMYDQEEITTNINIGWIEGIREENDNIVFETSIPGRGSEISLNHSVKGISGEGLRLDRDGSAMKFIERFLSSDYAVYMECEWTRSGNIRVEGE